MGAGSGIGLVLGGALTQYLSWHWVMYVNVPLALLAAGGAALVLRDGQARVRTRIDLPGAVLATAGMVALVYGFGEVPSRGWAAVETWGAIVGGAGLLAAFFVLHARVRHPLLPLRILTQRNRGGAYLAFVLVMIAMFGMLLLVSFSLQTVAGYSALQAGAAFLPFAAAVLVASSLAGRLLVRARAGALLAGGLLLAAAGMAWLTQLDLSSTYLAHVLPAVILVGLGTLSPVAANLSAYGVPPHDAGVASAVFNASEQLGASLGAAVLNTVATTSTAAYLATSADEPAALVHGFATASGWAAAALTVGALGVYLLVDARLGARQVQ